MGSQWFYSKNGQQFGPISAQELKQLADTGKLSPSDMVWKEGMAKGKAASKIVGLFTDTSQAQSTATASQTPPPPPIPPLWHFRTADGKQYGPLTGSQLKDYLNNDTITPDAYVWQIGWPQWRRASEVWPAPFSALVFSDFDAPEHFVVSGSPANHLPKKVNPVSNALIAWMAKHKLITAFLFLILVSILVGPTNNKNKESPTTGSVPARSSTATASDSVNKSIGQCRDWIASHPHNDPYMDSGVLDTPDELPPPVKASVAAKLEVWQLKIDQPFDQTIAIGPYPSSLLYVVLNGSRVDFVVFVSQYGGQFRFWCPERNEKGKENDMDGLGSVSSGELWAKRTCDHDFTYALLTGTDMASHATYTYSGKKSKDDEIRIDEEVKGTQSLNSGGHEDFIATLTYLISNGQFQSRNVWHGTIVGDDGRITKKIPEIKSSSGTAIRIGGHDL